jgi:hypothetical protein
MPGDSLLGSTSMRVKKRLEGETASSRHLVLLALGVLGALALALGIALHPLAVDDAFITYRYARNLAAGPGFFYNAGQPILSTTAPLYALVLAAGVLVWSDLPSLANALSAVALWIGAILIFTVGYREKTLWVSILAALMYILYPLLWLSLGLETATFLALGLGALAAYRAGRLHGAAILLALATMTRGDGLILVGVVIADYVLAWLIQKRAGQSWSPRATTLVPALGALVLYLAVMLPMVVWLTWQFGSPLPTTLEAKRAQAELGITGFYAHTTYLQGLGILARARLAQSPLVFLFVPAVLVGLLAMWREGQRLRLIVAWGAAHLVAYTVLGVTPYYWYYAPLVPGLVCAAALGVVESVRWLGRRGIGRLVAWGVGGLWVAGLLVALVRPDWAMAQALKGPVPPPDDPVSKVLPEAKAGIYEQAGHWLHDNAPAGAVVGVTEVGIMGYYAQRPMVDFLGLLEPDVSAALGRGDLYWALLYYQPDYLVLTAISPLYAYDLRADPWFQAAYAPVQSLDDPRFWGSPVTIYERRAERIPLGKPTPEALPDGAIRLEVDLGKIRLLGALVGDTTAHPGDVVALTLYWQALYPVEHDYTVFVHLLGQYDRVVAQRDAAPGFAHAARPTSSWTPGQIVADPHLLAVPAAAYAPDQAVWEVGLYDAGTGQRLHTAAGGDNVRLGAISIRPADVPLQLGFGPVALTSYDPDRLAMAPGETLCVRLQWEGTEPLQVTVQLVSEGGTVGIQVHGSLDQEVYLLPLGTDASPGAYDLQVLVTDLLTGQPLFLLGEDGQPRSDRARLTKIRVYP